MKSHLSHKCLPVKIFHWAGSGSTGLEIFLVHVFYHTTTFIPTLTELNSKEKKSHPGNQDDKVE